MAISPTYANSSNQIAALKELYVDDKDYMKNIVYSKNPYVEPGVLRLSIRSLMWLAMIPKNESPDGFAKHKIFTGEIKLGKYGEG